MILVYNYEKNPPHQPSKKYVRDTPSRDYLKRNILAKAGEEYVRFNLGRLQRLYFHRVFTYNVEEFERFVSKKDAE